MNRVNNTDFYRWNLSLFVTRTFVFLEWTRLRLPTKNIMSLITLAFKKKHNSRRKSIKPITERRIRCFELSNTKREYNTFYVRVVPRLPQNFRSTIRTPLILRRFVRNVRERCDFSGRKKPDNTEIRGQVKKKIKCD